MNELQQKEWSVARETIQNFDGRLHDLRKYGFSFLTALIAANAILTPLVVSVEGVPEGVPNGIKFAVLLVTLILIIALCLLDRSYVLFIESCVQRAMILERVLNIELTEIISQRHNDRTISKFDRAVYPLFSVGVAMLGLAFFWLDALFLRVTVISAAGVAIVTIWIGWGLRLRESERGPVDWILSETECERGDQVAITLTNTMRERGPGWLATVFPPSTKRQKRITARKDKRDDKNNVKFKRLEGWGYEVSGRWIVLKAGPAIGRVRSQHGAFVEPPLKVANDVELPPQGSYTWAWSTENCQPGIYEIMPGTGEPPSGIPLRRKIVVKKAKGEPPPILIVVRKAKVAPRVADRPEEQDRSDEGAHAERENLGDEDDVGSRRQSGIKGLAE